MRKIIPATLSGIVLGAGAATAYQVATEPQGSSPSQTIYSFVHALKHDNYGRACSYLTDKFAQEVAGGPRSECEVSLLGSAITGLLFTGQSPYWSALVVPGSLEKVNDNKYVARLGFEGQKETYKTVIVRNADGLWRVSSIA